jgi:hypothetical protein
MLLEDAIITHLLGQIKNGEQGIYLDRDWYHWPFLIISESSSSRMGRPQRDWYLI